MKKINMEEFVVFCKQNGFIYQGSDIYGGLSNTWDYGPLGVQLKNNIKNAWRKKFIQENIHNVELDSAILMNSKVWETSGHIGGFSDPLTDCKSCKTRHRADKLIEDYSKGKIIADGWSNEKMLSYINDNKIVCPKCGEVNYTDIRQFNLMFKTHQGVTESSQNEVYLRPETAQGIFINFKNIQRTMRKKIPFGVGQIGKSFRNEITPGNFIFRTREFEQMELEFFCKPGEEMKWFDYWVDFSKKWLIELGINEKEISLRKHDDDELSHYSNATTDIEYLFPWGMGELWGIASRTNFDLERHQNASKESLEYLDPNTNEKYIPYVIEPSLGADRVLLAFLLSAYEKEELENETRDVLRLHPALSPYKVSVQPLIKKYHEKKAKEIYKLLSKYFSVSYDDAGKIGKRYRRQDSIGTPYVVTIDDNTISDNIITLRNRDTMKQENIKVDDLIEVLNKKIFF